jgi:histidine triad (HIT) family protein
MSDDCIFCRIVEGDIPGRIVHESDHAVAFLDANPLSKGHTLVVPRAHRQRLADLSTDEMTALFDAVHQLTPRVEAAVDADAVTVGVNDGEAAGPEVPHVHVHLVPRFDGDGGGPIHAIAPDRPDLSDEELDAVADAVQEA